MRRRRRKKTLSRLSRLSQCNALVLFYRVVKIMILSDINDNSVFLSFIVGSTRFTLCQQPGPLSF